MNKSLVRIASGLFPNSVTSFAYKQLTNPQVRKLRDNELVILDQAIKERYAFKEFTIQLYTWGTGNRKILLIHGWEGQAGNFSDLIEALLQQNFTIYAFDAPSHGFSSKGSTSLFEFTELVGILIKKFQVKDLVSHSFGGVATTYALFNNQDVSIDKYVLLTTPDRFSERINDISTQVGNSEKVRKKLIQKLENELNVDVNTLNVSDFVREISVKKALIIHDKTDKIIPIERSKNVAENWKVSELIEIEGTGHFKILRTQSVIKTVVDYLV